MKRFALIILVTLAFIPGCAPRTSPPPALVTIGEELALRAAQGALTKDYQAGKMTRPQYVAASNLLKAANNKLLASNGVLTQADVDSLVNQAVKEAFAIYVPALPPVGPVETP